MSEREGSTSDGDGPGRIKILAIGDTGCGKTSLNITFAKQQYPEDINSPEIKWEEYLAEVQLEGKSVSVELLELPSQDHYYQIRTLSYDGIDVALMCFSVDDHESFKNIADKWLTELKEYLPDVPIVLVGTKSDLKSDERIINELAAKSQEPVSNLEALALSEKIKAYEYVECSAKTGEGVLDVYRAAVEAVAEM